MRIKLEKVFWVSVFITAVNTLFYLFITDSMVLGINIGKLIQGEWWRLFTFIFSHVDITHLLSSTVFLIFLGFLASHVKISVKDFLILYFGVSVIGILAVTMVPRINLAGSSLGIIGLFGAIMAKGSKLGFFRTSYLIITLALLIVAEFMVNVAISGFYAHVLLVTLCHLFALFGGTLFILLKNVEQKD